VGRPCMAGRRRACGERRAGRVRGRPLGDELDERRRGASVALDAVTPERVLAAAHIKARLVRPVLVSYSDTQAGRSLLVSMLVRQRMPSVGAVASWFRIRGPTEASLPGRKVCPGCAEEVRDAALKSGAGRSGGDSGELVSDAAEIEDSVDRCARAAEREALGLVVQQGEEGADPGGVDEGDVGDVADQGSMTVGIVSECCEQFRGRSEIDLPAGRNDQNITVVLDVNLPGLLRAHGPPKAQY
jgi:hypothetical protein